MTTIHWFSYLDADCSVFKVYRALSGFTISYPNFLVPGDALTFTTGNNEVQTVMFPAVGIDQVVDRFNNEAKGLIAVKSQDGTEIFVRCSAKTKARLKLYPCTFLSHTSIPARVIVPALEFEPVGTVTRINGTYAYSFDDTDGHPLDWYYVTSVSGSVESIPSIMLQPQIPLDQMCVVEGRLTDAQNNPVEQAPVVAELRLPERNTTGLTGRSGLLKTNTQTATDIYGRFSLCLVRNQQYLFQIPALGYNEVVTIPNQDTANFLDLVPTLEARYSPFEDPQ